MELGKGNIALCVTCLIAGILIGAGFRSCSRQPEVKPEPITLHDTLTVHDTLRIEKHTKPREFIRWDTLVVRAANPDLAEEIDNAVPVRPDEEGGEV